MSTGATGPQGPKGDRGARGRQTTETIWNQRLTLLLLLAFIGYQVFVVNPKTDEIHAAVCAEKENLTAQVGNTQAFLDDPSIAPSFNDPKSIALIKAQLPAQQAALDAYSVVDC